MTPIEFQRIVERTLKRPLLAYSDPGGKPAFRVHADRDSLASMVDLIEASNATITDDSLTERRYVGAQFNVRLVYGLTAAEGLQLVARQALDIAGRPDGLAVLSGDAAIPSELDADVDWDSVEDEYLPGMLGGYLLARMNMISTDLPLGALPSMEPPVQVLATLLVDQAAQQGWGPDDLFMSDQIDAVLDVLSERVRTALALESPKTTIRVARTGTHRGR